MLRPCAAGFSITALGLAFLPLTPILQVAGAGVLGIFVPPLNAMMRGLWVRRLSEESDRQQAASVESVTAELVHIGGRVIVAALGVVLPLGWILVVAAALLLTGTEFLVRLKHPGARLADPPPRRSGLPVGRSGLGRRLLATYLAVVLMSGGLGATSTGIVLLADPRGKLPSIAALMLALWGLGSALGGLLMAHRQLPAGWSLLGLAAGTALVISPAPVPLALLVLAAGLPIAPALTALYRRLQSEAPDGRETEALALATSALFIGNAAGAASAGLVARPEDLIPALLLGTAFVVLAAAVIASSDARGRLRRKPPSTGDEIRPGVT